MESKSRENRYSGASVTFVFALLVIVVVFAFPIFSESGKAQADTYKYTVKVKTEVLNVRTKAAPSAKKRGQVKKGKKLKATKIVKGTDGKYWYKVKYKGKKGYVSSEYVKKTYMYQKYSSKKKAYVNASTLNVRSKASTSGKKMGSLTKNKVIYVKAITYTKKKGTWYKFTYKKKTAYASAKYVKIGTASASASSSSNSFETFLTKQGFPASYKPYLRALHNAHPQWVFYARHTGYTWDALNTKARKLGVNLIDSSISTKWRSKSSKVYDSTTKKWTKTFDGGRWYQAKNSVIAYYLDPRNFLNDKSIFQFMGHGFDASSQNKATIGSITSYNSSCFMNNTTYKKYLYNAGKNAGVNPNVITAMIIEEQGWRGGSSLISGTCSKRKGYYNYFNIGAYCGIPYPTDKVARGLWYAAGCPIGKLVTTTSYGRPWDTKYKAIKGGALFYKAAYMNNNQSTYYTKKFNVMNGVSKVGSHEYMTNVMGAEEEGKLLALAYRNNKNYPIKFYIPVYQNMPSTVCAKPAS